MKSRQFQFGAFASQVHIGHAVVLPQAIRESRHLLVCDPNTAPLLGADRPGSVVLPDGEENKSWSVVETVLEAATEGGLARDGIIVGIGGGVLCDVTALAASLFMRGCRLFLVPTTLLAMVDAAVGGKTAINYMGFKNLVGTFYPAEQIHIFTEVLESLPRRHYLCGLAEVIKSALLGDRELYTLLITEREAILKKDAALLVEIIDRCVAVKGRLVEEDPREAGIRAHLNLGHTFAHAMESVQLFSGWSHGEAVAWGIARAMDLGILLGITDPDYAEEVKELLGSYDFVLNARLPDPGKIIRTMRQDKKRREGQLRFVVQRRLGETLVLGITEKELRQVLGGEGTHAG
jgi:3-dehydroquinate synthase